MKAGGTLKIGGEKEKMKEQTGAKKGSTASMVVDGEAKEESGVGVRVSLAMAVGGSTKAVRGLIIMMEVDRLDCVMIPIMSSPRKHSEQVRMEEGLPKASRCGKE